MNPEPRIDLYDTSQSVARTIGALEASIDWDIVSDSNPNWSKLRAKHEVLSLIGIPAVRFAEGDDIHDVSIACVHKDDLDAYMRAYADEDCHGDLAIARTFFACDLGLDRIAAVLGIDHDYLFELLFKEKESNILERFDALCEDESTSR